MIKKSTLLSLALLLIFVVHSDPVTGQTQTDPKPANHFESYENVEFLGFLPGSFHSIKVHGNYAYTGCPGGLCVIDVANPRRPKQISFLEIPIGVYQIVIDGDFLFTVQSEYDQSIPDGVLIINISDPGNPKIVSIIKLNQPPGWISDMAVYTHRNLYISWMNPYGVEHGVNIFDISDPLNPIEIGFIDIRPGDKEAVNGISINGNLATFLHGEEKYYEWYYGIARYDISNPLDPINLGRIEPGSLENRGGRAISIQGNRLYVEIFRSIPKTPMLKGGLRIYDISNPLEINFMGDFNEDTGIRAHEVMGHYAYLSGEMWVFDKVDYDQWTYILDVYEPEGIIVVGYLKKISPYGTTKLSQKDGLLYMTDSKYGLYILRYAVSETLTLEHGGGLLFKDPIGMTYFVHVPEVAMTYPTELYFAPVPGYISPPGNAQVGDVFELSAYQDGKWQPIFPFATPINIEITYNDELLDLVTEESQLMLRWWNGSEWIDAADTCTPNSIYNRNPEENILRLQVCELGRFGLFGPTETLYLPVINK
jgi:hypothetical protein